MPCHIGFSRISSWCTLPPYATLIQEHFGDAQKAQEEGSEQWFEMHGKIHANTFPFLITSLYLRGLSVAQIYRQGGWCVHQYKGALCYPVLCCTSELCCDPYCSLSAKPWMWEAEECAPGAAQGCFCWRTLHLQDSKCWHAAVAKEPALEPLECVSCSSAWQRCGLGR